MSTAAATTGLWGPGGTFGGAVTRLGGAPAAFTAATGLPYYVPIAGLVALLIVIAIIIIALMFILITSTITTIINIMSIIIFSIIIIITILSTITWLLPKTPRYENGHFQWKYPDGTKNIIPFGR